MNDYSSWIKSIVKEYKKLQIKKTSAVNVNMLTFFYKLGQDIQKRVEENIYGSNFFNNVSKDLIHNIPNVNSFSVTNLRYMVRFYNMVNNENLPQIVEKFNILNTIFFNAIIKMIYFWYTIFYCIYFVCVEIVYENSNRE